MPDEPESRASRRAIEDVRQQIRDVRSRCYDALNKDRQPPHAELRQTLLAYWDHLSEYRDEASETWEDNDLDKIREHAQERVEVRTQKPGYGGHTTTKTKPKLAAVDTWTLIEWTQGLDEVAKELGFAANTARNIHNDEPDMSDLRALLKRRGQTDALENLPGDD